MNIRFARKNGNCPYYVYKNIKFLIMDRLLSDPKAKDEFVYYLAMKDITEKTITFESHKKAMEYMDNLENCKDEWRWLLCKNESEQKYLFTDKKQDYIVNKNIVTIKNKPTRMTADYDKYFECLRDAKEFIEEYIEKTELKGKLGECPHFIERIEKC